MRASEPSNGRRVVPIACTLSAVDQPARVAEWRAFASTAVESATQADGVVTLRLVPTESALLAAVSLAEREKQCCAFFEFSLTLEPEGRMLRISVPDDARDLLTGFYEVLTGS